MAFNASAKLVLNLNLNLKVNQRGPVILVLHKVRAFNLFMPYTTILSNEFSLPIRQG